MIIGITGTIASGKGKAASYFHSKGFTHHSFSSEIREIAKERKIEINRMNLEKLGLDLRLESPDVSILGKRVIELMEKDLKKNPNSDFVVEGIRDISEIKALKDFVNKIRSRFVLIGIDADIETRFKRLKKRARHGDPKTFVEFKQIDEKELDSKGQEVSKCLEHADFLIDNSGPIDELYGKLEEIIQSLTSL